MSRACALQNQGRLLSLSPNSESERTRTASMNRVFLCGFNTFSQVKILQDWLKIFGADDKHEENAPSKQTIDTGDTDKHSNPANNLSENLVSLPVSDHGDDNQHTVLLTKIGTLDDSCQIENVQMTWSRIGMTISSEKSTKQEHQQTVVCGFANQNKQHQQQEQQQQTQQQQQHSKGLQLKIPNCRLRACNQSSFLLQCGDDELLLLTEDRDQEETVRVTLETGGEKDEASDSEEPDCTVKFGTVSGTVSEFVASYDGISVGKLSPCTRQRKLDQSGNSLREATCSRLVLTCLDSGLTVQVVSCGLEHSVFLTAHGSVLSCGTGSRGQLGHGNVEDESVPQVVSALEGVRCTWVAAGGWHSAAVTECGDLFMWGWNECGQLGLPSPGLRPTHSHTHPQQQQHQQPQQQQQQQQQEKVCDPPKVCKAVSVHQWPQQVEVVVAGQRPEEEVVICKVACGSRHTAILTETGQVFTSGWNQYRQLGLPHTNSVDQFSPVSFGDRPVTVTQLWCGAWNTLFVVKEQTGI